MSGETIAIMQCVNRKDGTAFNDTDIDVLESFAVLCGSSIHNMQNTMATDDTAQDIVRLAMKKEYKALADIAFNARAMTGWDCSIAVFQMFRRLDLLQRFSIDELKLGRFILTVKNNYRNVAYHNWKHAFEVTHACFTICINANLMVSGMCACKHSCVSVWAWVSMFNMTDFFLPFRTHPLTHPHTHTYPHTRAHTHRMYWAR